MSNWKDEFIECLEGSTSEHSQLEKACAMKAEHMPKHLYRYQADVEARKAPNQHVVSGRDPPDPTLRVSQGGHYGVTVTLRTCGFLFTTLQ
jgi:hypothetical protein